MIAGFAIFALASNHHAGFFQPSLGTAHTHRTVVVLLNLQRLRSDTSLGRNQIEYVHRLVWHACQFPCFAKDDDRLAGGVINVLQSNLNRVILSVNRFDMFDGEYTHEGDRCTFEVMIQRFRFQDRALVLLAEVVHDIDLKDAKYGRAETGGFNALLTGLTVSRPNDGQRMTEGFRLFENLYAYFQQRKGESQ